MHISQMQMGGVKCESKKVKCGGRDPATPPLLGGENEDEDVRMLGPTGAVAPFQKLVCSERNF